MVSCDACPLPTAISVSPMTPASPSSSSFSFSPSVKPAEGKMCDGVSNGLSANGLSANGMSANGMSANGMSANVSSSNGMNAKGMSAKGMSLTAPTPSDFQSRYADDEPRMGCDILIEALEREGVHHVFAYPGGSSIEIHQALTRSKSIKNILCRHEQGEVFAAEGYAKASGRVGVCIATSGPGATNLVTGLADAMMDSVPLVAITGQVPRRMIGTNAFQETAIVDVTRSITKHNCLVMNVDDIPRVIREAFFLAGSGRPGPVLVDIPKDIQQAMSVPDWSKKMRLDKFLERLPCGAPSEDQLDRILRLLQSSKRPVLLVGGGCIIASKELNEFVARTGVPVTHTLMGHGVFPSTSPLCLQMLGMHGTVWANYAVQESDLLLTFGARFDDRATGKAELFAARATIVHVDIDQAELGKIKTPHLAVLADVKAALGELNRILRSRMPRFDFTLWVNELEHQKQRYPLTYPQNKEGGAEGEDGDEEAIAPQHAIAMLRKLTKGHVVISTGVGQHQMWTAQFFGFDNPRRLLTSGGLGTMGFGLPAAIGAAVASPGLPVIDIDGDGSFMMNVQELATIKVEKLPVKIMILNNQHLGMVRQWEDRFYKGNHAHTYLGEDVDSEGGIFPDFRKFAEGCKIPCARVTKKRDLVDALHAMLDAPGPYLLDVIVSRKEHVLPMIPGGGAFEDTILGDDGAKPVPRLLEETC